jgi:hypothetical protein
MFAAKRRAATGVADARAGKMSAKETSAPMTVLSLTTLALSNPPGLYPFAYVEFAFTAGEAPSPKSF